MRIAFYAPLKPPDHPVPSGDRRMARLLIAALARAGHEVELASRLRSYDGAGDAERQGRIAEIGGKLARAPGRARCAAGAAERAARLAHLSPLPQGAGLDRARGSPARSAFPIVVAEASVAAKRAGGPWALGHDGRRWRRSARADAVISLNPADDAGIAPLLAAPDRLHRLQPFLDAAPFAATRRARPARRWRATIRARPGHPVAARRRDDARAATSSPPTACSARRSPRLPPRPGSCSSSATARRGLTVEAALAPARRARRVPAPRRRRRCRALYAAADLFVWPAINEAYGMAMLEAQAAGLPVGRRPQRRRARDRRRRADRACCRRPARRRLRRGAVARCSTIAERRRALGRAARAQGRRRARHRRRRRVARPRSWRASRWSRMTPLALHPPRADRVEPGGGCRAAATCRCSTRARSRAGAAPLPRRLCRASARSPRRSALPRDRGAAAAVVSPVEPRLVEMDWGDYEGYTLAELRAARGVDLAANEARGLDFRPPGGESPRDVQARLAPLLAEIAARRRADAGGHASRRHPRRLCARDRLGHDGRAAAGARPATRCTCSRSTRTARRAVERLNLSLAPR